MIHFFGAIAVGIRGRLADLLPAFSGSGFISGIEFEVCRKGVVGDGVLPPVDRVPELEVAFFEKTLERRFLGRSETTTKVSVCRKVTEY